MPFTTSEVWSRSLNPRRPAMAQLLSPSLSPVPRGKGLLANILSIWTLTNCVHEYNFVIGASSLVITLVNET